MAYITESICKKAADIAQVEANKCLIWTDGDCEAEKYLKPLRHVLGQPYGRFSWCAAFVTWCMREAGSHIPDIVHGIPNTVAYVPMWEEYARANSWWTDARDKDFNPRRGDVVLYDWSESDERGGDDHIGIILSYEPGANYFTAAEGNTSNETAIKTRAFVLAHGFIRFPAA